MHRPFFVPALSVVLLACERAPTPSPQPAASATAAASSSSSSSAAPAASPAPMEPGAARFMEDLNKFCVITQEVKSDKSIPEERRATEIVARLVVARPSPEFLRVLQKPSDDRYKSLRGEAAARGATNWNCPALAE